MDKALLILDLDETLIFASEEKLDYPADCTVFNYFVYLRPMLKSFLTAMQKSYQLAIWSSAGDNYVEEIVQKTILKEFKFEFIWGRSRATYRRNFERDELRIYGNHQDHYQYVKILKKVKKLGFSINRTLILDDTPHKSQMNYGNAIYPRPFEGSREDKELLYLTKYLEKIKDHPNYRRLEKRNWRDNI